MEFSFGSQRWLPRELFEENCDDTEKHALGLHAPGFFDKVLNVNKCLLQSDPANKVCYKDGRNLKWIFYMINHYC